jgi:hypothetical protein
MLQTKGRRKIGDLINQLPYATDAPFNAYQRQNDPSCLPNTRTELLHEIYKWADGQDKRGIFWLNGLAGAGKSTIARTVARKYFDQKHLGASFFFSRGGGDIGHAGKLVTSIAVQLATNIPSLQQHICNAIQERRDIASQSLHDQWKQLILRPLLKLSKNSHKASYVLVIDALDECDNDNNIRTIIHLLAEAQSLTMVRLRVFLTSRPEVPIRHGFVQMPDEGHQDFILHSISPSIINHDIRIFLDHTFRLIAHERSFTAGWPGEEVVKSLVQNASGLFIWAATACRFIREGKRFAAKRLGMILKHSSTAINAPEKHLDKIYITVLRHCFPPEYIQEEAAELLSMLKSLLGSIVTLLSPLSIQSLSKLLGTPLDEVDQTLHDLHAILDIPKDSSHPLRLHHPSFRDFLLEKTRCEEFWVNEKQAHHILADSCIQLMSASLKQDVCGVDNPSLLVSNIERNRIQQSLLPEVQYACRYWIEHVQKSGSQLHDNGQVYYFLQEHFLHWLEALGWMENVSEGVHAIAALESSTAVRINLV